MSVTEFVTTLPSALGLLWVIGLALSVFVVGPLRGPHGYILGTITIAFRACLWFLHALLDAIGLLLTVIRR